MFETLDESPKTPQGLPWAHYFIEGREALNLVILPLYVILTSTLLLQTEYRDKTWKQVLSSPQKLVNIFCAKYIILHLLIVTFLISYNLWVAIFGWVIESIHPQLFDGGFNFKELLATNTKSYFLIFGISAIQFWLALRFKNFIASLAIGFCLWLMAPMMIFELHWSLAKLYPYSFPVLSVLPKYKGNVGTYQWLSMAHAVVFLSIGFFEFAVRKVKG
jgi:hypothetical protein